MPFKLGTSLILLGITTTLSVFFFYALRLKLQGETLYNNQARRLAIIVAVGACIVGIGSLLSFVAPS